MGPEILVWFALVGCNSGRWTQQSALQPTLTELDTDHDGRVDQAEYARVAFPARAFSEVDGNADGGLSVEELGALVFATDPLHFFMRPHIAVSREAAARHGGDSDRPQAQGGAVKRRPDAYYVLLILREEVLAKNPAANVPTREALAKIGMAGALTTSEAVAALSRLEAESTAVGLDFPAGLRAVATPGAAQTGK